MQMQMVDLYSSTTYRSNDTADETKLRIDSCSLSLNDHYLFLIHLMNNLSAIMESSDFASFQYKEVVLVFCLVEPCIFSGTFYFFRTFLACPHILNNLFFIIFVIDSSIPISSLISYSVLNFPWLGRYSEIYFGYLCIQSINSCTLTQFS